MRGDVIVEIKKKKKKSLNKILFNELERIFGVKKGVYMNRARSNLYRSNIFPVTKKEHPIFLLLTCIVSAQGLKVSFQYLKQLLQVTW